MGPDYCGLSPSPVPWWVAEAVGTPQAVSGCIFNGDKMTVIAPIGVITSCSSEQMIDSDYLKQHGFAMAY